ncbi:alcohol dehydrogenase-like 4 protein [Tanacetum coccineum]
MGTPYSSNLLALDESAAVFFGLVVGYGRQYPFLTHNLNIFSDGLSVRERHIFSERVVESVGEGVDDMKEGDHVLTIFNGECGECAYCKSKTTNLCAKFRVNPQESVMRNDGKTRFLTQDGKPIYHFLNTSTFSEYTVMDSACVVKIDPKAPLNKMTLLSCCLSTGFGAVINTARVYQGSTVAVFGLGAVGLAVIQGAQTSGASKIVGIDINDDKKIKGQRMGMTDFLNPKDLKTSVHEKIRNLTGGGVDFSFECAGNLDVLREAFLSTHDGWGSTIVLGIHPTPRMLPLHPMELFDGRTITGSVFGGFKGKSQLPIFAHQCIQDIPDKIQDICDNLDIGVHGRRKK